jgi:hypothetical protein
MVGLNSLTKYCSGHLLYYYSYHDFQSLDCTNNIYGNTFINDLINSY